MTSAFEHALSPAFIKKLKDEAENEEGWWASVLADPKLFLGLRGSYLNVYWRGQALFTVEPSSSGLNITTHEKFLVDPELASQVPLIDGKFQVEHLVKKGFIHEYQGKKTLEKMKTAAGLFSGNEKTGCHQVAIHNPTVIDCEVAFPGTMPSWDGGPDKRNPRVDLAAVEEDGNDVRLVFWEAKHFNNPELRAADGRAPVLRQVEVYRKYVTEHRDAIVQSYAKVAENLVHIRNMGWNRSISPLIADVATGDRKLSLGETPRVGLIIFGFDLGQKKEKGWNAHLDELRKAMAPLGQVLAVGDAKGINLPS